MSVVKQFLLYLFAIIGVVAAAAVAIVHLVAAHPVFFILAICALALLLVYG
jgi:hypothetical protein